MCDASRDVHRDASDIVAVPLDFTGMQPAAHRNAELPHRLINGGGAAHRPSWAIEGRHEPIAEAFYLVAAEARELLSRRLVVLIEQGAPVPVAEAGGAFGRVDDVGEQYRRKHSV